MTSKVRDILKHKGSVVHIIQKNETVYKALARMLEKGVGSLVVMDDGKIVGIVSERDFIRKVALKELSAESTHVEKIMTKKVIVAGIDDPAEEYMAAMTEKRIRHLPVMEGKSLVGLVSIGDLIKQVSKDQKVHLKYLTDYIIGKYPA